MATEIEIKLGVPDKETLDRIALDSELTQYMRDDFEIRTMRSTYYDTPDHQLAKRLWTLRLRDEGGVLVAAFKTANQDDKAGFFTRGEWQCFAGSIEEAIPTLIEQGAPNELMDIVSMSSLSAVCGAEFTRSSNCLFMDDGVRIELALDYGFLFNGQYKAPICEAELELMYGDAGSLMPISQQLCETYGLCEESDSKYVRAKQLGNCKDE